MHIMHRWVHVDESGKIRSLAPEREPARKLVVGIAVGPIASATLDRRLRKDMVAVLPGAEWPPHSAVVRSPLFAVHGALCESPQAPASMTDVAKALEAVFDATDPRAWETARGAMKSGRLPPPDVVDQLTEVAAESAPGAWGIARRWARKRHGRFVRAIRNAVTRANGLEADELPNVSAVVAAEAYPGAVADQPNLLASHAPVDSYLLALSTLVRRSVDGGRLIADPRGSRDLVLHLVPQRLWVADDPGGDGSSRRLDRHHVQAVAIRSRHRVMGEAYRTVRVDVDRVIDFDHADGADVIADWLANSLFAGLGQAVSLDAAVRRVSAQFGLSLLWPGGVPMLAGLGEVDSRLESVRAVVRGHPPLPTPARSPLTATWAEEQASWWAGRLR